MRDENPFCPHGLRVHCGECAAAAAVRPARPVWILIGEAGRYVENHHQWIVAVFEAEAAAHTARDEATTRWQTAAVPRGDEDQYDANARASDELRAHLRLGNQTILGWDRNAARFKVVESEIR